MNQSLAEMLAGLWRVILLRGSPERVHYSRRRFVVALLLAVAASAGAQVLFHEDHVVFVILRVFAELTMFMLAMVLLTARVARFRLAYVMLLLVMISLAADAVLMLLSGLFVITPVYTARYLLLAAVSLTAWYGAGSVMAWGLRAPLSRGLLVMAAYLAAATVIDLSFRWLYDLVAAG